LPQDNQELSDLITVSFKVAEKTNTPVVLNKNTEISETVQIPSKDALKTFLDKPKKKIKPGIILKPQSVQDKTSKILTEINKTAEEWYKKFRRNIKPVEVIKQAKTMLVVYGINARIAEELITDNNNIGLLSIRMLRPWPAKDLENALQDAKRLIVIDEFVSGSRGIVQTELGKGESLITDFLTEEQLNSILEEKDA
jgi:pyruvate/2-oxoacid:ferredoxin oxidoreductase alpha subunit